MAKIYVIQQGDLEFDRVSHSNVVGFTTKRVANTVLRRMKREDTYEHQYSQIQELDVYETEGRWKRGLAVKKARVKP